MKLNRLSTYLACVAMCAAGLIAGEPASPAAGRIGVYDSRAVAYAHFWSPAQQAKLKEQIAAAKAARDAGDPEKFEACDQALKATQEQNHLQVFSTAPVDALLAEIAARLPAIQSELGVARLVSKWDEAALQGIPEENRVDATDRLVREYFTPTEKQQKVLDSMNAAKPLPLAEARRLLKQGKL